MIKKTVLLAASLLFVAALFSGAATAQSARDYISIVGSSTVYPFATVVAEQFGKTTKFKTPKIESTGSGGGFKLFCAGVGTENPDITNASRAMKKSEFDTCQSNGVKDIVEVKIGYDGIVVANSKKAPALKLTRKDLFLALAKDVPDPKGGEKAVANPYKTWKDVNPALPNVKIEVLGPPPPPARGMPSSNWSWSRGPKNSAGSKPWPRATRKCFRPFLRRSAKTAPTSRPVKTTT